MADQFLTFHAANGEDVLSFALGIPQRRRVRPQAGAQDQVRLCASRRFLLFVVFHIVEGKTADRSARLLRYVAIAEGRVADRARRPPPTGVEGGALRGYSMTDRFSAEDLPFCPG